MLTHLISALSAFYFRPCETVPGIPVPRRKRIMRIKTPLAEPVAVWPLHTHIIKIAKMGLKALQPL